jgi:hypothetical protein
MLLMNANDNVKATLSDPLHLSRQHTTTISLTNGNNMKDIVSSIN